VVPCSKTCYKRLCYSRLRVQTKGPYPQNLVLMVWTLAPLVRTGAPGAYDDVGPLPLSQRLAAGKTPQALRKSLLSRMP
jgi:hypothetical protein